MANFESPFVSAQGTDTATGYNMAATAWPDFSGSSQLQFAQMLGMPQQSGGWYQNQGFADVWFPSQSGFTDASMIAALNAKLQTSPELWMQQLMAGASSQQMLQQQVMQRQMAQSDSAPKDGQAKATGGVPAPPGISSTTPINAIKAGGVAPGEKAAPKAARPGASSERTASNEAGAKAGQLLLNLVNNKEEKPSQGAGAALLQQLKGGGKKPEVRSDDGAGMALLQQVKNGEKSWTQGTGAGWSWWNSGKSTAYEGDWDDWGQGKAGKKGKSSDWGAWNSGADWWGYGQEWSNDAQWWAPSAPQWTRQTPKKGKGKGARPSNSQDTSEGSERFR